MSIFPKRVSEGNAVVIHNAFHLRNFEEGLYFPLLEINIIDPKGEKTNVFSGILPVLKSNKESIVSPEVNHTTTSRYKFSPLVVLGRYFASDDSVEELTNVLSAIPSGKHFYHTYAIPENAVPGRYEVETLHYLNGEKFYSKNKEEDFFYVESLSIAYKDDHCIVHNHSLEACPVRITEYNDIEKKITGSSLEILKGKESRKYSFPYKAFLQYNEDRKVIPLFGQSSIVPVQNPALVYTEKSQSVLVFTRDKASAYELENEYLQVWKKCNGIHSKNEVQQDTGTAYEDMKTEGLIIEMPLGA